MDFEAIIFDLDGTLIDSMQIWRQVDQDFLLGRGIEVPADLFDHIPQGNSFIGTAQYFKERFQLPDSIESIMEEWNAMLRGHYENDVELKPGAGELLETLAQKGVPIGLGTSNSLELSSKVLAQHGIWHYFNSVVTGDMPLKGKPFPDIYLKVAQELNLEPSRCLVVEDTLTGVQAAKAAGMTVVAIHDEDSIPFATQIRDLADAFVQSHYELSELLKT